MSSKKQPNTEPNNLRILFKQARALMDQAKEAGWTRETIQAAHEASLEFETALRADIRNHPRPIKLRFVRDPKTGEGHSKTHIPKKRVPKKPGEKPT
ncbi:MAG: hypothetical protein ABSF43_17015 [Rectinemataceae bacterium]|jgi:hypothetical protein